MKTLLTLLTCLFILSPNDVLSETVKYEDLVKREGLFYKKFTDVPFTGKTSGRLQGSYKNGKKHGPWVYYYKNGQLNYKGTYKDGKWDGPWVYYHKNGQLDIKGTYKDGKEEGPWVRYWNNGQLFSKGTYKDGKRRGLWTFFNRDGTKRLFPSRGYNDVVVDEGTGTYKDDKKISD